jgi:hypothetical protein
MALEVLKAPSRAQTSPANDGREKRWNSRHEVMFKNSEVSRLDRCYFDRWKEPECNLFPEKPVRDMKPTWALEKVGAPDKTAKILTASSDIRHAPHGNWNARHERMFSNDIHCNLKSYFSRKREPEDMAASKLRKKVTDDEKLKIDWSLQVNKEFFSSKTDYHTSLRAESAPALSSGSEKQKKPPAWFSSHGVLF